MTNAELAILSLVAEQPRHGYEIEQVIESRGMREWTEVGFSSIYYLLKKLASSGWIESRTEPAAGRGPARRVYAITPAGRTAWLAASLQALSDPQPCFTLFQIGLANLPGLSKDEVLTAFYRYRQGLEERLAHIQLRQEEQRPLPVHVEAIFDHSHTLITAELAWVNGFIQKIETGGFQ